MATAVEEFLVWWRSATDQQRKTWGDTEAEAFNNYVKYLDDLDNNIFPF